MFDNVDWSIVIAISSLLISAITLYVAHLRGPKIELAIPDKTYPCHGLREADKELWTLVVRFLLVNTGNRPGVIFSFRLDPADEGIGYYRLDTPPELALPQALMPGSGWKVGADIQIKTDEASLKRYTSLKNRLHMKAVFSSSGSFRRRTDTVDLWIDLKPLKASLRKAS